MRILASLFLISWLYSCKSESKFDLEKDLYRFSEKMENGDTVEIQVNRSACLMMSHEVFTFTKAKDTVFLQTYSEISSFEKREQTLPKIAYDLKSNDSLSFENYLIYLNQENKPKTETHSFLVYVYYKNKAQSRSFYDDGLEDKFKKLDKLASLREKIYPDDTFFTLPEPPPPPRSYK